MLAMFWLWGIAIRVFELMKVEYEACFSILEQSHLLSSRQVYQVAWRFLTVKFAPRYVVTLKNQIEVFFVQMNVLWVAVRCATVIEAIALCR